MKTEILDPELPEASDGILREQFYGRRATAARDKPTHYKVICISLYTEDIVLLEGLVAELKRRGHTRASKSGVIRHALGALNIDDIPKED